MISRYSSVPVAVLSLLSSTSTKDGPIQAGVQSTNCLEEQGEA